MARSWLASAGLAGAALLLATGAGAGGFADPFQNLSCPEVSAPYNALANPNVFQGNVRCVDLCKSTEKDALKYTNAAQSCRNSTISHDLSDAKKMCANEEVSALRKSCQILAAGDATLARSELKSIKSIAVSLLDSWLTACVTDCTTQ